MSSLFRRLGFLIRRRRADDELTEELQFHRDMAEVDLQRNGLSQDAASREARRAMGNTTLAREDARAVWVPPWIDGVVQDVRHSMRSLWRSPALIAVSVFSLGLGIGLNMFLYMGLSAVYGHRPTMVEPERVVGVEPGNANQFSYPDYQDLLRSRIFQDALGFRSIGMNLGATGRVTRVSVLAVSGNFFDVLGARAQVGRTFSRPDAVAEREPRVVVVTSGFWKTYLRGAPSAIGESLVLNGEPFTVVGVLPDDYRAVTGWMGPGLYVPLSKLTLPTIEERGSPSLSVLARLTANTTAEQTEVAVTTLTASLEREFPDRIGRLGRSASVFPASEVQFRGSARGFMVFATIAWATAALVLFISCINVMGLLMARAVHRRREIAIRVAIGAGRFRVVQSMLVESFLLVVIGAAAGLPLAFTLSKIPFGSMAVVQDAMALDRQLLLYAIALVVLTTLFCGVVPALRATRADVVSEVRQGGESVTPRLRLRQLLVVGQVAMSLVLIVGALLCVRSQLQIARTDFGFDLEHGVVARFTLDRSQYPGDERFRFSERLVERIVQIPGITSASAADFVPLGGDSLIRSFHPAGRTDIPGTRPSTYSVGVGYFRTLAIPFVKGRDFDTSDRAGTPTVAIVNETFAKTYFSGREAIGQRVQTVDEPEAQVIGVVRDNRIGTIGEAPQSVVYYAYSQRPRAVIVHARTSGSPDALLSAVQHAIDEVDATVPVSVQTLRSATSIELSMRRVGTMLMGAMGVVGLLLAVIGLYGVLTYVVATRTAEVGIRMTLGASGARIRQEMLQRALVVVGRGVVVGAVLSLGLTPAFSTFLAGVSPFDPVAFGGAAALLMLVGLAAGYVPARRSAQLDPMRALRQL